MRFGRLCFAMVWVPLLALSCAREPEEDSPPSGIGANFELGCRTAAKCVAASGGSDVSSDEAQDRAQCVAQGGTEMLSDRCPPAPGGGCCRTVRGNARVVTCIYDGSTGDPGATQASCVADGGAWDTVDRSGENNDTPETPAEFVTGCDFANRTEPGKSGRYCVLYPASHIGQSCKEPRGVPVTTCGTESLLGCCRAKGPILSCSYESADVTLETAQADCAAVSGVWWPGLAP